MYYSIVGAGQPPGSALLSKETVSAAAARHLTSPSPGVNGLAVPLAPETPPPEKSLWLDSCQRRDCDLPSN